MENNRGFNFYLKCLTSGLLFGNGLGYAIHSPGPHDVPNGIIIGLAIYCIWFAYDRQSPNKEKQNE